MQTILRTKKILEVVKETASQSFDYLLITMIATTLEKSKRKVPLFVVKKGRSLSLVKCKYM